MKVGGQTLWNASPVCEMSQISYLMGKLHIRDVLGNHLRDRLLRLVHWLSIALFLRKTSQETINLERKYYLDCSWIRFACGKEFGRVTIGCRH